MALFASHTISYLLLHLNAITTLFFQNVNLLIYTLILLILILVGTIIYLVLSRRKLWIRFNKIEQQLILTQINPHFIFNSLTAIQSYIFRNDPLQAGKYLSSFAKLVRLILESSRQTTTSIEQEIKILRFYFDLQTLRFEGKFEFKIEVDEALDIDEQMIPPMLAQPFIENSIEHGYLQLSGKGVVTVRFIKQKQSIIIEVEDNGIGIDKSMQNHIRSGMSHQTLATELTSERIKKIWEINRIRIKMDIIDLNIIDNSKQGSIVKFIIPISN